MRSSCRGWVLPGLGLQTHLRLEGVVILLQVWTQSVIKLVWEIHLMLLLMIQEPQQL